MKKYLQLTWFHLKSIAKQPLTLAINTIFPLIMISVILFFNQKDDPTKINTKGQRAFVINHSTLVSEDVIEELPESFQYYFTDDEELAYSTLKEGDIAVLYEIEADFPEKNKSIKSYSLNGINHDLSFERTFIAELNNALTKSALDKYNVEFKTNKVDEIKIEHAENSVDSDLIGMSMMIFLFQFISTALLSGNLNKLRKDSVLKRSLISKTGGRTILASLLSAYAIYFFITNIICSLIPALIFNLPLDMYWITLLYFLAMDIFTVGLIMLLFRLIKDQNTIQGVSMLLGFAIVYTYILGKLMGGFWENIQYISPVYWALEGMDRSILFPNVIIVALMGVIAFTAGTMKLEKIANAR